MAVDFYHTVYLPAFSVFARPVIFYPLNGASYSARGIFDTREIDVVGMDGSIYSDAKTILDILINEFAVLPKQGDRVMIPPNVGIEGGMFEVFDLGGVGNAGGQITITLKRVVESKPVVVRVVTAVLRGTSIMLAQVA